MSSLKVLRRYDIMQLFCISFNKNCLDRLKNDFEFLQVSCLCCDSTLRSSKVFWKGLRWKVLKRNDICQIFSSSCVKEKSCINVIYFDCHISQNVEFLTAKVNLQIFYCVYKNQYQTLSISFCFLFFKTNSSYLLSISGINARHYVTTHRHSKVIFQV